MLCREVTSRSEQSIRPAFDTTKVECSGVEMRRKEEEEEVKRQKININQNVEIAPFLLSLLVSTTELIGHKVLSLSRCAMLEKLCNIIDQPASQREERERE